MESVEEQLRDTLKSTGGKEALSQDLPQREWRRRPSERSDLQRVNFGT